MCFREEHEWDLQAAICADFVQQYCCAGPRAIIFYCHFFGGGAVGSVLVSIYLYYCLILFFLVSLYTTIYSSYFVVFVLVSFGSFIFFFFFFFSSFVVVFLFMFLLVLRGFDLFFWCFNVRRSVVLVSLIQSHWICDEQFTTYTVARPYTLRFQYLMTDAEFRLVDPFRFNVERQQ